MSTPWEDLRTEVMVWTKRPALVAETDLAIRLGIRAAHRSGKFWRDLTTVQVSPALAQIQSFNMEDECPGIRQVATIKVHDSDVFMDPVVISDLLDTDGFARTQVYWGVGTTMNIRAQSPYDSYDVTYYMQPDVAIDSAIQSWIFKQYREVVVLLAASNLLGIIGEADIKKTVDAFAALAITGMRADSIEINGR